MRTIRASELSSYFFCRRAWWLRQQGFESDNQARLDEGVAFHQQHGREVFAAGLVRLAGWLVLLVALAGLAAGITLYLLK